MLYKRVILVSILLSAPVFAAEYETDAERTTTLSEGKSKAYYNQIKALQESAQKAVTPEYQAAAEKLQAKTEELKLNNNKVAATSEEQINLSSIVNRYSNKIQEARNAKSKINRLLIFVSLSMPKQSLNQLSSQAKKAGGVLVLRGLVNNSWKETAAALMAVNKQGIALSIDPRLFKIFNVQAVPSFVVLPNDEHPCPTGKCSYSPVADIISGDISLEYALEAISSEGNAANAVAVQMLQKLRGES